MITLLKKDGLDLHNGHHGLPSSPVENVHRDPEGGDRAEAQEDGRENSQGEGRRVAVLFVHRSGAGNVR